MLFYGASIAFRNHSYRFQVTCTFLRSIHSFYNHSYHFQFTCTFCGKSIVFAHHSYCFQVTYTVLRSIHSFYRSFLSFQGHLHCFNGALSRLDPSRSRANSANTLSDGRGTQQTSPCSIIIQPPTHEASSRSPTTHALLHGPLHNITGKHQK